MPIQPIWKNLVEIAVRWAGSFLMALNCAMGSVPPRLENPILSARASAKPIAQMFCTKCRSTPAKDAVTRRIANGK